MRKLTLKGYLEENVRSLSLGDTMSIFKLVQEIPNNHRIREPLFLYALSCGKIDILLRAAKDNVLQSQYLSLSQSYSWSKMLSALESRDASLDNNFHKTYRSYLSKSNMAKTNNDTKVLMYKKIRRLQTSENISNYRIYTDLKLNPGNANAFLKNGDLKKINMDTVRKMVGYLERVQSERKAAHRAGDPAES